MNNSPLRVFFGAAIQAHRSRGDRRHVYAALLGAIKDAGHAPITEHTAAEDPAATARALEQAIGPLPAPGPERTAIVRDRLIEAVEGDVAAAVFEVSVPSLGTGVELTHAYLRPRLGLKAVPVLALYEKDFWPNGLSTMIAGIRPERVRALQVREYGDLPAACALVKQFLSDIPSLEKCP